MGYTLAIDQGTHASRALLYDTHGQCLHRQFETVPLHHPLPGQAEQDPDQLLTSVQRCLDRLLTQLTARQRVQIGQCGITTQRSTVLAWRQNGAPLSAALSWQDVRGAARLDALQKYRHSIHRLSGLPLSAHYGASKLHWLVSQYGRETGMRIGPLSAFLVQRLTSGHAVLVDHSNAQRTQLFDIESRDWSAALTDWFEVPASLLPASVPVQHLYGELAGYGIPVSAVCGDQSAAWFGQGLPDNSCAHINIGSGAFVLAAEAGSPPASLLRSIASSTARQCHYLVEGTVNGAGTALEWLQTRHDQADLKLHLDNWLRQIDAPPLFLNTIGGLGSPWWQTGLAPRFVPEHARLSLQERAVAVVESIAFLIQNNLEQIRKQQLITHLRVTGGLSKLSGLCQKLANLSGLDVSRVDDGEASARGVAWLASGQPAGWGEPGTAAQLFEPRPDSGLTERYRQFCAHLTNQLENPA